jgi:acyl carrier protein
MMHDNAAAETETVNNSQTNSSTDYTVAPGGTVTAEAIEGWMVAKIAQTLQMKAEDVDIKAPFVSYGLESIVVFSLTGDLADWLDRDLEATLLWEHPTIEDLSQHLSRQINLS